MNASAYLPLVNPARSFSGGLSSMIRGPARFMDKLSTVRNPTVTQDSEMMDESPGKKKAPKIQPVTASERPIIFSAPMVRAILEGRKTQTRRVVKPQPERVEPYDEIVTSLTGGGLQVAAQAISGRETSVVHVPAGWRWKSLYVSAEHYPQDDHPAGFRANLVYHCPYGAPGDRLWVREAFAVEERGRDADGGLRYRYRANGASRVVGDEWVHLKGWFMSPTTAPEHYRWRPPIYMPRWASRITLEVTGVRVERLQDITVEDCQAEGCTGSPHGPMADLILFPTLWDTINGKRAPWASNPWVWVVEFKPLPGPLR
jgi:hypothetical protein